MFLKNKNIIFIIRRSKVTDYPALTERLLMGRKESNQTNKRNQGRAHFANAHVFNQTVIFERVSRESLSSMCPIKQD